MECEYTNRYNKNINNSTYFCILLKYQRLFAQNLLSLI